MAVVQVSHRDPGVTGVDAIRYVIKGRGHNGHHKRNVALSGMATATSYKACVASMNATWQRTGARRKKQIEIYRYIQSFSKEELDPNSEQDIQFANQLGRELAEKIMYNTHHRCVIATQIDGRGGNIHNHIVMQNQDYITGKCLRGWQTTGIKIQRLNDQVLSEHNMKQPDAIKSKNGHSKITQTIGEKELRSKGVQMWKDTLSERLDDIIENKQPTSFKQFYQYCDEANIDIIRGYKKKALHITTDPDGTQHRQLINDSPLLRGKTLTFRMRDTDDNGKRIQNHAINAERLGEGYEGKGYTWSDLDQFISYFNQLKQQTTNRKDDENGSTFRRVEKENNDRQLKQLQQQLDEVDFDTIDIDSDTRSVRSDDGTDEKDRIAKQTIKRSKQKGHDRTRRIKTKRRQRDNDLEF